MIERPSGDDMDRREGIGFQPMKKPVVLFNRNYQLLWFGQFISRAGTSVSSIVLILWIKGATGSASLMGLMAMLTGLTGVLFGTIGGTAADRFSRRKIIAYSDALSGLGMLVLAALFVFFPAETDLLLVAIIALSLFAAIADAFSTPAITAAVPDLVPPDSLARANSITQMTIQLAILTGQGLGGILYRVVGVIVTTVFNGITYLIAAMSENRIDLPHRADVYLVEESMWKHELRLFRKNFMEGMTLIWQTHGLKDLVIGSSFLAFFSAPVLVLFPFYVSDVLRSAEDWVGFLSAAYGAGSMLGFVLAGIKQLQGRQRAITLISLMLLDALFLAVMGFVTIPMVALVVVFLSGMGGGYTSVYVVTIVQMNTPSESRGRMFGFLGTLSGSLAPLGMAIGGLVFDWTGKQVPPMYFACGMMMAVLIGILSIRKSFRAYLATDTTRQATADVSQ